MILDHFYFFIWANAKNYFCLFFGLRVDSISHYKELRFQFLGDVLTVARGSSLTNTIKCEFVTPAFSGLCAKKITHNN